MKKVIFYSFFITLFMSACGQSPDIKTHIYSRITLPGIRPETDKDNNDFPKAYFIYAEVKKGSQFSAEGCWIEGKYYSIASIEKVSTPVIVSDQTVIKMQYDTLVKKTTKDVYHIIPGEEKPKTMSDEAEKKLAGENKFVLLLKLNGKQEFSSSATIKELTPAAMM